jgi:hypothetical protein
VGHDPTKAADSCIRRATIGKKPNEGIADNSA